jgi:hypothetical protein
VVFGVTHKELSEPAAPKTGEHCQQRLGHIGRRWTIARLDLGDDDPLESELAGKLILALEARSEPDAAQRVDATAAVCTFHTYIRFTPVTGHAHRECLSASLETFTLLERIFVRVRKRALGLSSSGSTAATRPPMAATSACDGPGGTDQ